MPSRMDLGGILSRNDTVEEMGAILFLVGCR